MSHTIPRRRPSPVPLAPGRLRTAWHDHPVAVVAAVALLARVVTAVVAYLLTDRYTIPDESLYIELGRTVVNGVSPDVWYPGYGEFLYHSVEAFIAPLVLLFRIFGPERLVGALFSAVVGAACAAMTVVIARRFLRPAFALAAGLVVALTPSQVLFSSVVLREPHVWLALLVTGLGAVLLMDSDRRRLAAGAVLCALGLLGLAYLRDQTMLAAAWALALAVLLGPRRGWIPRVAVGLLVALAVPAVAGSGIGGWSIVDRNAGRLAETRAKLAVGANTAFGGATPVPGAAGGATASGAEGRGTVSRAARAAAGGDDTVSAGVEHLPGGFVDVTLRPFPWQSTVGLSLTMARVEMIWWYLLYVLAIVGVVVSLRRRAARLALQFPVLLTGMLIGIAALTQGNLGTAFRHRDQIVWILALCSAAGAQWLWTRAPGRVAAAPTAVEMREQLPVLSAADNSLSANGR